MISVRALGREEVEPLLADMRADGLDVIPDEGEWLGAAVDGRLAGAVRLFERKGLWVLDDVWVEPQTRRRGLATALIAQARARRPRLWLICDEPDVGFYERRGFEPVEPAGFPEPLAAHYAAKDEWPRAADHAHVAMRAG